MNKNGTSPRVTQKLTSKYGNDPNVSGEVIQNGVPNRADILQWEQNQVDNFSILNKGKGPRFQSRPQPNNN